MNKTKLLVMLSLFAILMTVFGNVMAQDSNLPAFKVTSSVTDEKVVLTTKNVPADTASLLKPHILSAWLILLTPIISRR